LIDKKGKERGILLAQGWKGAEEGLILKGKKGEEALPLRGIRGGEATSGFPPPTSGGAKEGCKKRGAVPLFGGREGKIYPGTSLAEKKKKEGSIAYCGKVEEKGGEAASKKKKQGWGLRRRWKKKETCGIEQGGGGGACCLFVGKKGNRPDDSDKRVRPA